MAKKILITMIIFIFFIVISGVGVLNKASNVRGIIGPVILPSLSSSNDSGHSLVLTGSNYTDIASNNTLQLTNFSIASWFRTTMDVPFGSYAFIVNKGGIGSDARGNNLNYGIWITSSESIQAGFEDSSGVPYVVESPGPRNLYDLNEWHYAVVTYDGLALRLYMDGVPVSSKLAFEDKPDNSGTQPVRIGANSLAPSEFFIGSVGEVRIWNRALTHTEISYAYTNGIFNTTGQVLFMPFR